MALVLSFDGEGADLVDRVGGKAANLAKLAQGGFPVPPGFCITTDVYSAFLEQTHLDGKIAGILGSADFGDAPAVEAATQEIAQLIVDAIVPDACAIEITEAYQALGDKPYVAVRSSGTAEDMAEASFAGLHDTYLDVTGADAVVDAVKRCWASLWNPRAAVYRHNNGIDQATVRLAVVVQIMVEADVSGVMFTANPLTSATDEIIINASWGLGEAVVQGSITPDLFVVKTRTLRVLERSMGTKLERIVRDRTTEGGVVTEEVPRAQRERFCLTDDQVGQLAELGRRVQLYYDEFPQDTEWALADGSFYLLQSRPITGVEFSWDADVEIGLWGGVPEDDDAVWTRAFADEITTGAVTPLTYSVRYPAYSLTGFGLLAPMAGSDYAERRRMFKYHKGEVYCDTQWAREIAEHIAPPVLRPSMLGWANPQEREDILAAPFKRLNFVRFLVKTQVLNRKLNLYYALRYFERHWRSEEMARATTGLSAEELRKLSDADLKTYCERQHGYEDEFGCEVTLPCLLGIAGTMTAVQMMLDNWYDGKHSDAFVHLISGCSEKTDTQRENAMLWHLAERIRHSETLRATFGEHRDGDFFEALKGTSEGRSFLAEYHRTIGRFAHRGHAERDMLYPRRSEDPSLDYQSFQTFLSVEQSVDPEIIEEKTNQRRESVYRDVEQNLRSKRLGFAKAKAFRTAYRLMHREFAFRDNERQNPTDLITMSYKRGYVEMGRRLHERSLLAQSDDFYYLSKAELYDLFQGVPTNMRMLAAKIGGRRRDVDRMLNRDWEPPKYLQRGRALDLDAPAIEGDIPGQWRGTPTSAGTITGIARVVPKLSEIGRVRQGEILVVNATDPGWTPVFLLVSGIVVETGGPLAHAACLAREYGLPAVQLERAMRLIPDGATITVNGGTGSVTLLEQDPAPSAELSVQGVAATHDRD